jgi:hypothetical protein
MITRDYISDGCFGSIFPETNRARGIGNFSSAPKPNAYERIHGFQHRATASELDIETFA